MSERVNGTCASSFRLSCCSSTSMYSCAVSKVSKSLILPFSLLKATTDQLIYWSLCFLLKGQMLMTSCAPKHFKKSLQRAQRGLDVTTIVSFFPNIDFFKALSIFIALLFSSSNPSKNSRIGLSFYIYLAVSYFKCSYSLLSYFFVQFSPDKSLSL